jgi:hypothetical protein
LAGRPLTLTESHDSAEEYSLSQLSFNHKKSLRVAMAQRLSCHGAGAKLPLSGLDAKGERRGSLWERHLDQRLVIERSEPIAASAKPLPLLPVHCEGLKDSRRVMMVGKMRKIGIAAVAALTFGGAIATASTEALAFKGGFGGGGFGGHGFGGGGFAARGFGGGGFAARGFGGGGPMFAGRSVAARPGFATRSFAGAGFAGRNWGGRNWAWGGRGFRHRGFGVGLGLATAGLVGAAAYGYGYPYYYGCDPYDDYYGYGYGGYACGGGYPYPYAW